MLGVVVIRRIWTIKVWINTVHKATITKMWNKILGREFVPFVARDLSNVGLGEEMVLADPVFPNVK